MARPNNSSEQMVLGPDAFDCGIKKSLVHSGKEPIDYVDGTRVLFHYKTMLSGDNATVLDDSKKMDADTPMELIIGKKFKLEVWERAIKTMWSNEVAKFTVLKDLLYDYPVVSKQLRDYYRKQHEKKHKHHGHEHEHKHKHDHKEQEEKHNHHCCGFNLMEHGVGHADLDALLKSPKDLDFIFEIVKVDRPNEYEKESWVLTEEERTAKIPVLKEQGNALFKRKEFVAAQEKYGEALSFLEHMMLKEKPNDVEWNELNDTKVPILLNFCLCKFNQRDYYSCIEHVNTILEHRPGNVKALFRRAKAHTAIGDFDEARADFAKCVTLDESLRDEVGHQLVYLKQEEKNKKQADREKYQGKLFA